MCQRIGEEDGTLYVLPAQCDWPVATIQMGGGGGAVTGILFSGDGGIDMGGSAIQPNRCAVLHTRCAKHSLTLHRSVPRSTTQANHRQKNNGPRAHKNKVHALGCNK